MTTASVKARRELLHVEAAAGNQLRAAVSEAVAQTYGLGSDKNLGRLG